MSANFISPAKTRIVYSSFLVLAWASLLGASVAVSQTVSANFAGRSGATPWVPSGLFSLGGTGTNGAAQAGPISTLTSAGLDRTRFWISLGQIYATSTANFSLLDQTLTTMSRSHLHPLAVIYDTPRSLGPSSCSAPSDVWRWGQMAASVVAHVDQKFPGLLEDYEIWNEPELAVSLCISNPTDRLNKYVSIFSAAAAAMHAQASKDGKTIRTGGPTISQLSSAKTWFPALLNSASAARYVDFVSFHLYLTGETDIWDGMSWSSLYATTQSTTHGLAYYYKTLEALVRKGHQPNAITTPIFITEFNDNWAYLVDCCRNDPTYAPLWNSVAVADFLNVIYSGARQVPSQLSYFASSGKYFCIMGHWDWDMDCDASATEMYPQFYAFELFASSRYLNLQGGGHMAASVTPGSTTSGLDSTAFYTNSADNIVIINPTSTAHNAVSVELKDPGLSSSSGTVYLLNKSHGAISSSSVGLKAVSGGYSAQVSVPAYSTVALSVKGQSSNRPLAALSVTPTTGKHPLLVAIDSSASKGGASAIAGRTTDFGDGHWASYDEKVWHTYTIPGTYRIVVTIKNTAGQISAAGFTLIVK